MKQQNELLTVMQDLHKLGLPAKEDVGSYDNHILALSVYINDLIANDFAKLVHLLYRLDVSEDKVLMLIKEEEDDKPASISIAQLIIERQLQKIKARKSFKSADDIPEDEKW